MRAHLFIFLLLFAVPLHATAKPIVADISSHQIEIHSAFTGTQLLLFGARNEPGDIVIIIRGPSDNFTIRRKEQVAGMWINRDQYAFEDIPKFYAIATSRPIHEIKQYMQFQPLHIGASEIIHENVPIAEDHFASALLRKLQQERLYTRDAVEINFISGTLFRTVIDFPDRLPRGTYTAEIYLISGGEITAAQTIPVEVYKTGFDAFIYDLAQNRAPFYGALSIFIALLTGWAAYTLFQRL